MRDHVWKPFSLRLMPFILLAGCGPGPASIAPSPPSRLSSELALEPRASTSLSPAALRENLEKIFAKDSSCPAEQDARSRPQLRLLTRDEYNRTIQDALHLSGDYRSALPLEQKVLGFRNNAEFALVSSDHAAAYDKTAKEIAQELVNRQWSRLMDCPVSAGVSCAEAFIKNYGPRLWRRPLRTEEQEALLRVYAVGREISDTAAMELLLRGLLTSPHFLYRSETGADGHLTAYEMASALAYFFWGEGPDSRLLELAASGALLDKAVQLEEVQRLLRDDRSKVGLSAFVEAWLNHSAVLSVNKDSARFPNFDGMRPQLARETETFFDYVVRDKESGFVELLSADYSLGDQSLATYYGAQLAHEDSVQKLRFPDQPRVGILGHGSVLASLAYAGETGPIQRGKFVREHLLCDILMPPPPNLMIKPPAPKEGATTRERFAEHTSLPVCRGCHVKIDGVGFAMEDFDAIGLYRQVDNGKPVDASGQVVALDGRSVAVNGARELSLALASSPRAQQCFVVQAWRMVQGRLETANDVCTLRQLSQQFVQQNMSVAQLLVTLITDPSYSQRSH